MVEYLIANPLAMVAVFIAFITAPLLYELLASRRAGDETEVPVPVPVQTKPARKQRKS